MKKSTLSAGFVTMFIAAVAFNGSPAFAQEVKVVLNSSQQNPAVTSSATGSGTVTVNADMSVTVNITTSGIAATAAHIHMAPAGQNGPVIVPFVKNGDSFTAVPGAKLTEAQFAAFKAGNLYENVHSAANPGGEIRAQLRP